MSKKGAIDIVWRDWSRLTPSEAQSSIECIIESRATNISRTAVNEVQNDQSPAHCFTRWSSRRQDVSPGRLASQKRKPFTLVSVIAIAAAEGLLCRFPLASSQALFAILAQNSRCL